MGEEAGDQMVAVADPLYALLGRVGDLGQGGCWQVGQIHILEVGSEDAARLVR